MSRENVEALRALYDEWGRGNFGARLDLYDRDVLLVTRPDLPESDRYVGLAGISAFMRTFLESVTDMTYTAEEFTEVENSIVVATYQRGIGKQSGLPMEGRAFVVWTFRGRAVIRIEFFSDRATALEAVGLSE